MKYKLYRPSELARIREKHGFRNVKGLGQNFLADEAVIEEIIERSDIEKNDLVIEIGPGVGTLTAAAAERAGRVAAVELDSRLIPVLEDTLSEYGNVEVINADIMKTDITGLIEREKRRWDISGSVRVIGNLPYYITTPVIMMLLETEVPADSITVMMQKEVADRIMAPVGTRTAGAVTIAVNYYCTAVRIAEVPKEVFVPVPKVDSAVVRLDRRRECPVELLDEKVFFQAVKNGFGQRRKTLLNSLTGTAGITREQAGRALKAAGIDASRRAETLTIEEFADISNAICKLKFKVEPMSLS